MIPFKLEDKDFEVPSHHGEMNLRQFLTLRNLKNPTFEDCLVLFTGLTKDEIYSCEEVNLDVKIWPHLEWITKECDYIYPRPNTVTIGKKVYSVPNISEATYGQKIVFKTIYDKAVSQGADLMTLYPEVLALYFYPLLKGKFTEHYFKDEYINNLILDIRIDEALPAASFFLTSSTKLLSENQRNLIINRQTKRSTQGLRIFKYLATSKPYTALRNTLINLLKMFCKRITTPFTLC